MVKKEELPAMPFYWGDWFKSPDVQSLPRETKCVWFEILGRMWESTERGYLTINYKPMSDFAKARALGFGDDVKGYLEHEAVLEDLGLFSRREVDNAIYSRKILHINNLREKRKLAGALGGKQTQSKSKASSQAITENENETETEDKDDDEKKILFNNYVWLKPSEADALKKRIGSFGFNKYVEGLDNYKGTNEKRFKKYTSHYSVILSWWHKDGDLVDVRDIHERQEKEYNEKYGYNEEHIENVERIGNLVSAVASNIGGK